MAPSRVRLKPPPRRAGSAASLGARRASQPGPSAACACGDLSKVAVSAGLSTSATSTDSAIDETMVSENWR